MHLLSNSAENFVNRIKKYDSELAEMMQALFEDNLENFTKKSNKILDLDLPAVRHLQNRCAIKLLELFKIVSTIIDFQKIWQQNDLLVEKIKVLRASLENLSRRDTNYFDLIYEAYFAISINFPRNDYSEEHRTFIDPIMYETIDFGNAACDVRTGHWFDSSSLIKFQVSSDEFYYGLLSSQELFVARLKNPINRQTLFNMDCKNALIKYMKCKGCTKEDLQKFYAFNSHNNGFFAKSFLIYFANEMLTQRLVECIADPLNKNTMVQLWKFFKKNFPHSLEKNIMVNLFISPQFLLEFKALLNVIKLYMPLIDKDLINLENITKDKKHLINLILIFQYIIPFYNTRDFFIRNFFKKAVNDFTYSQELFFIIKNLFFIARDIDILAILENEENFSLIYNMILILDIKGISKADKNTLFRLIFNDLEHTKIVKDILIFLQTIDQKEVALIETLFLSKEIAEDVMKFLSLFDYIISREELVDLIIQHGESELDLSKLAPRY